VGNSLIFDNGTNVGIGTTTPTAALTVGGTNVGAAIDWTNTTASTGRNFRWVSINSGAFAIEDITAGLERMRITSGGNVGIGATSPTFKLDVNGTFRAQSLNITVLNTAPATATSAGVQGEIRITATHIYVCSATNTWVRTALTTF
jgi:hypothetical protein